MNICQSGNKCTGCLACYNICPVGAIEVKETNLGEIRPSVVADKCIHCKKCSGVCASVTNVNKHKPIKVFAAFSNQEQDKKC